MKAARSECVRAVIISLRSVFYLPSQNRGRGFTFAALCTLRGSTYPESLEMGREGWLQTRLTKNNLSKNINKKTLIYT